MIGGGDQIYNDSVRVKGPLKPWTDIGNPQKRQHYPFGNEMRKTCDQYYYENYVRWYSTEPFATANASIAQINIWDDHDIITRPILLSQVLRRPPSADRRLVVCLQNSLAVLK